MFSNLSQNSILYILDLNNKPRLLSGPVERVSVATPKYNSFSPNLEMVVDITATINGERREFKGVPNGTIANFGDNAFIIAESKDSLTSYVNSMLQSSKNILNSVEKHEKLVTLYEDALQELDPNAKKEAEKDKIISSLQTEVSSLKNSIQQLLDRMTKGENPN